MIRNRIDAQLSTENENKSIEMIRELETLFPFLVNFAQNERKQLPKLSKKALDFVERSLMYGKEYPQLVTPFVNLPEQERDIVLYKQLQHVLSVLDSFHRRLRDTYLQVGAEAYGAARMFYTTVKKGASLGEPNCSLIAKDLSGNYKRQLATASKGTEESDSGGNAS